MFGDQVLSALFVMLVVFIVLIILWIFIKIFTVVVRVIETNIISKNDAEGGV